MRIVARMSRPTVRPLEAADVPAAAALLARRHGRHRRVQPLLSPRFEEGTAATEQVAAALAMDDASGAVAEWDGRMIGYLLGAPKPGEVWGPNIWVEAAGQAVLQEQIRRPRRITVHGIGDEHPCAKQANPDGTNEDRPPG